jgi:transcriptional accessory protein Tex/SPT6
MTDWLKVFVRYVVWAGLIALTVWCIYDAGHKQGLADARLECSKGQTQQAADSLSQFITSTQELTSQANTASRQLAIQIAARAAADDQSSREIRDALKKTAAARVNCVFDADIMQKLAAARERAATAAASGIAPRTEREMSSPAGPGG